MIFKSSSKKRPKITRLISNHLERKSLDNKAEENKINCFPRDRLLSIYYKIATIDTMRAMICTQLGCYGSFEVRARKRRHDFKRS